MVRTVVQHIALSQNIAQISTRTTQILPMDFCFLVARQGKSHPPVQFAELVQLVDHAHELVASCNLLGRHEQQLDAGAGPLEVVHDGGLLLPVLGPAAGAKG